MAAFKKNYGMHMSRLQDEKTLELFLVVSLLYKFQRVNIDEDVLFVEIWS